MSSKFFSSNINKDDLSLLIENYNNFKEDEAPSIHPQDYVLSIEEARYSMVNWLSFLCNKLNFTDQTLFRSVSIFDQYISRLSYEEALTIKQENLNLITIACLSLSTKLEEINCNYISFLNERVLNSQDCQIYTNKDLTKMELQILKTLKYKTLYSTPIDFVDIYIEVYKNIFNIQGNSEFISEIKKLTINLMKNNINNILYLTNTSSNFAYFCFNQVLNPIKYENKIFSKQMENNFFKFSSKFANIF